MTNLIGILTTSKLHSRRAKDKKRKRYLWFTLLGGACLLTLLNFTLDFSLLEGHATLSTTSLPDAPGVRGTFKFSAFGNANPSNTSIRHRSVFKNGPQYSGMEDNDLRGFLDGNFKWGWNQPSQSHIRIGRRGAAPALGEHELFRVIQRWDDLVIPTGTHIHHARLSLKVEKGTASPLQILLYEVNPDWNPGKGGTGQNNNSPPKRGEVWWGDVGFQEQSWGLPGAGYASDSDPQADTAAMPLAEARYHPGAKAIDFTSPRLSRYIESRAQSNQPLLFLIKLADYLEDVPGNQLALYSANYGAGREGSLRRPQLILEWEAAKETTSLHQDLFLEYGRTYRFPKIETPGATGFAATFESQTGYDRPTIQIRGGNDVDLSSWRPLTLPVQAAWDWVEVQVLAATDPIHHGSTFEAKIRDTWMTTGPPKDQEVLWTFISPYGISFEIVAKYLGDYTWGVNFQPEEIGRWRYSWTQQFIDTPYQSPIKQFDVIPGDQANIQKQIQALQKKIKNNNQSSVPGTRKELALAFLKLERAVMQQQTPSSFSTAEGIRMKERLNTVRSLLTKKNRPPQSRMVAMDRKW